MKIIETERLILRTWAERDAFPYYLMNQDPKVLEFLRGPLTQQDVRQFIAEMNQLYAKLGYTLWAAEEKSSGEFIGFIGLEPVPWESTFTPSVEVGWRLGAQYWGKGFATEGAKAALKYGFEKIGLKEIVAFTVPANVRSLRVMEKIGMVRDLSNDFKHPKLPQNHKLSHHVLYRIKR